MATVADLTRIAPEFSGLDETTILQPFLDDAAAEISESAWGDQADRVIALLAAHALACTYPDLYKQRVTSNRVGEVSQTYQAAAMPSAGVYGSTRFGLEVIRLRRQLCLTPRVI